MKQLLIFLLVIAASTCFCQSKANKTSSFQKEVQAYLDNYNNTYQKLYTAVNEAQWLLNTKIVEGDTLTQKAAEKAGEDLTAFTGSTENIEKSTKYLKRKDELSALQVKQLQAILYFAGSDPQTVKDIVKEKIKADAEQTRQLYGFDFKFDGNSVTTNQIDDTLKTSKDLATRLKYWEASKEVGKTLKSGLANLQQLRNKSVQALGYKDFFSYQVSDYGMSTNELLKVCREMISELWPLYRELHTWARYTLAERYGQKVPDMIPAHWLPNRWGQEWEDLVDVKGLDLDKELKQRSAGWIIRQGEEFYESLGFGPLGESFYEKSSLYPLPENSPFKKNNHASAWHIDLKNDVRSLMSVEPNTEWWGTVLHELGHIYYFKTYSNPDVPLVLRNGANRAFHEAMGSLIGLASMQTPFLEGRGLVPAGAKTDNIEQLLKEALEQVVLIPWGAGVMTEFEYELYANNLPKDQYNKKWWELKRKYQGIEPPKERGEEYCDAASKTHINDDPAQYYDYSMSVILLFQFHDYIAKNILHQDPHATNYWGEKKVGDFLKKLMRPGASKDWRELLKQSIGSDMSAKAMIEYFSPLRSYLKEVNKGRKYTLPENIF
ncbi:MAG: M2 family metallopeptidase [Bacteroidota bacterium]|nr:M2 family metallopeptidase [Bacteroidota bacterium]